ncbi:MAG: hypothetical protein AB1938_27175 [Myxococcota bacterium]
MTPLASSDSAPGASGAPAFATRRVPLLVLGAVGLATGLWTGLQRMGALPAVERPSALAHGPLMVSGFLGVVIALERAVAGRSAWGYAGPVLCGAGVVLLAAGAPQPAGWALLGGSAVVVALLVSLVVRLPALHHAVLAAAAVTWLVGNALLVAGRPVLDAVFPWLVLLVGTIAGERLELTRVLPRPRGAVTAFVVAAGAVFVGGLVGAFARDVGVRLFSTGALALAVWLFRFDVARRTVRQVGLVRFIAVALLSGYAWLAIGGVLGLAFGHPLAGPRYDALLHALFVGFVFSMIFGHAPIILPAVLGVRLPFRPRFYAHLALLHLGLVLRTAGDLTGEEVLRRAGSWGNVAAIVLFLASSALAAGRRTDTGAG